MARFLAMIGLAAALVLTPAASLAGPRAEALLALESGNARLEAGELDAALALYDEAIQLDPELARAHHNRGLVLARLDRLEEAIGALETAVGLEPDDARIHFDLALAYYANDDLFWASDEIAFAAELDADDPLIAYYEGRILFDLGELAAAQAAFERSARHAETADRAGYYLGLTQLLRGQRSAAEAQLEAVASSPAESPFTLAAGEASERLTRDAWDIPPLVSGMFILGGLYDTNVILEPAGSALPLGAEAPGLSLWGSFTLAPVRSAEHLLSGTLTASRTFYFAEAPEQFNTTFFGVFADYRYRFLAGGLTQSLGLTAGYDAIFLDGGALTDEPDFYAYSEGILAALRHDLAKGNSYRYTTELTFRHRIYADMRRDGQSYRLRTGPTLMFLSGRLKLLISAVARYDNASGRGFDLWGLGATTGISALAWWQLFVRATVAYTHHDHFDSAYYSGWGAGRTDDIVLVNLGLRRVIYGPLSADLGYTHTTHLSTTPAYDYTRNLVVFSLIVSSP